VQGLVAFVRALGATRIAAMTAVTVSLVAFFAFLIMRVTAPQMATLYTDLSVEDTGAVVRERERQGID
jgi:flagellar M-ring protein FliF